MASPITTSARAPEAEHAAAALNEPSMEDILASIRRIIAEDQSHGLARGGLTGLTRRTQVAEAPVTAPAEDAAASAIDALHPMVVAQEADLHVISQADGLRGSYDSEPHAEASEMAAHEEAGPVLDAEVFPDTAGAHPGDAQGRPIFAEHPSDVVVPHESEAGPLMSPSAGASITSSFQALAESVVLQDPGLVERIMRETMRPLLKEWLDDHLPSVVERLVRAEIERVARGGRSRD